MNILSSGKSSIKLRMSEFEMFLDSQNIQSETIDENQFISMIYAIESELLGLAGIHQNAEIDMLELDDSKEV